jgi:hypothetical protein
LVYERGQEGEKDSGKNVSPAMDRMRDAQCLRSEKAGRRWTCTFILGRTLDVAFVTGHPSTKPIT